MARRKSRSGQSQRLLKFRFKSKSRRNKTQKGGKKRRKKGGRGDLLTPLLLLGAQQLYAGRTRRSSGKSRRRH